jgi:hypothetical protein
MVGMPLLIGLFCKTDLEDATLYPQMRLLCKKRAFRPKETRRVL